MLGHLDCDPFGQVENLARLVAVGPGAAQAAIAVRAASPELVGDHPVRVLDAFERLALAPFLPARLALAPLRSLRFFFAGLLGLPRSDEGGLLLLRLLLSSDAIFSSSFATRSHSSSTRSASASGALCASSISCSLVGRSAIPR